MRNSVSEDKNAKLVLGEAITVSDAVERLPFGWAQAKVFISITLCWAVPSCFYVPMNLLQVSLINKFGWDEEDIGALMSLSGIACCVGCILASVGDVYGRRNVILYALAGILLLQPTQAYLSSFYAFSVVRISIGVLAGIIQGCISTYFCEFLPIKARGFWLCLFHLASPGGALLAAYAVYATQYNIANTFWICTIPAAVSFVLTLPLPESPRFLMINRRHDEAVAVVRRMYSDNGFNKNNVPEMREAPHTEASSLTDTANVSYRAFMSDPSLKYTFLAIMLPWCLMATASSGFQTWLPYYMHSVHKTKQMPTGSIFAFTLCDMCGVFTGSFAADRVDRRVMLGGGLLMANVATVLLVLRDNMFWQTACGSIFQFSISWAWLSYGLVSCECFPTSCRVFANGSLRGLEGLCYSLSPLLAGHFFALGGNWGHVAMYIYAGCNFLGLFAACIFLRNMTMTGLSLADQVGGTSSPRNVNNAVA